MPKEDGLFTGPTEDSFRSRKDIMSTQIFPDKKERPWTYQQADDILIKSRELAEQFEVGQKEGTFVPNVDFHNVPIGIALMTDTHYGSLHADTRLLNAHLDIIRNTPNFYLVHNGDHTDNFNATGKWASGMADDPLPQQTASRAWAAKLIELDLLGKIAALGFGNHDDFGLRAGQDYHETFLSNFKCPIFTSGGLLHIAHGTQTYDLAFTHMYWGYSKLNPTNANKRFMDFEHPNADISFLGHTHQHEGLHFEKGGKDRIACIGGTYKDQDDYARKNGIGGRAGSPGFAVLLWPDQRRMQLFEDLEVAKRFLDLEIKEAISKQGS